MKYFQEIKRKNWYWNFWQSVFRFPTSCSSYFASLPLPLTTPSPPPGPLAIYGADLVSYLFSIIPAFFSQYFYIFFRAEFFSFFFFFWTIYDNIYGHPSKVKPKNKDITSRSVLDPCDCICLHLHAGSHGSWQVGFFFREAQPPTFKKSKKSDLFNKNLHTGFRNSWWFFTTRNTA